MRAFISFAFCFITFYSKILAQQPQLVVPVGHTGTKLSKAVVSANKKFILTNSFNEIKIWDFRSSKLIKTISAQQNGVFSIDLNKASNTIVTTGFDLDNGRHNVMLYNIYTSQSKKIISSDSNSFFHALFFDNDKKLVVTSDTAVYIINVENGSIDKQLKIKNGTASHFITNQQLIVNASPLIIWNIKTDVQEKYENISSIFSGNNDFFSDSIIILSQPGKLLAYNFIRKKSVFTFSTKDTYIKDFSLSKSGKYLSVIHYPQKLKIWNLETNQTIFEADSIEFCEFDSFSKKYLLKKENKLPQLRNINTKQRPKEIKVVSLNTEHEITCLYSQDKSIALVSYINQYGQLASDFWDMNNEEKKGSLTGQTLQIDFTGASFNLAGDKLFTSSTKSYNQEYDLKYGNLVGEYILKDMAELSNLAPPDTIINGRKIIYTDDLEYCVRIGDSLDNILYSIYPINKTDCIFLTPKGFYKTTPNASKLLHYVTKDLKVITFEQLDVKYNRPDKVLEAIGNTDTALINSYRKAYQKRIKKLGIDTTQFADGYSVPEADFVNRDDIDYEQNNDKISLSIKANDSTYKLDRFNVWVNEVPVFGLRGLRVKRKNNFDTTITITLSQGENRIETSVTNINGTESYKMPLFVKYTPAFPKETKVHFIGIGINQFSNTDYNLNWSVKDIRDLAIKFKSKYPNIIIDTLFDKNVTKENILALKKKLLQLNEDDKVIVSYSGHGVLSKDFDYFLSTYSIDFTKPEENGLAYDDLESLLDNIKPRQKLLLIDACHSGEVDKDELLKIEMAKTELDKNGVATKSTIKVVKKEKQLGMANSFELMQNLFVNVGKGTGATIISAAGGTQYAQERGDLKNGVFTYSIIEAMNNNPKLTVSELKKQVGERVTQLTNGLQKPTSRNETNNYDWWVW